ncbi:MAG: hypothetical protein ACK6BZ_07195 [Candidatus Kapaibacterium sp.]
MPSSGFYKAETQSRGSKDEKIPLIEGWQTQSDGVDLPKTAPRFFRLPRRGIGMGLNEMPHSFQRTKVLMKIVTARSFILNNIM